MPYLDFTEKKENMNFVDECLCISQHRCTEKLLKTSTYLQNFTKCQLNASLDKTAVRAQLFSRKTVTDIFTF